MSRSRSWRRAQALRLIERRYQRAKWMWTYSFANRPDWIEEQKVRWDKVNPWTMCSCWMCQLDYTERRPRGPFIEDWDE